MTRPVSGWITVAVMSLWLWCGMDAVQADSFIFRDTTDNITLEHSGGAATIVTNDCPPKGVEGTSGQCFLIFNRNGLGTTSPDGLLTITEDPQRVNMSDFVIVQQTVGDYRISFASFTDGSVGGCLGGCDLQETGLVQTAFVLNWADGSADTVSFQSDQEGAAAVPEPTTGLLLATGLLGLLGYGWRQRKKVA